VKKLGADLGGKELKQLVDDVGANLVKKLADDLTGRELKQLADQLGTDVLKKLAADATGAELKQLVADVGADVVKHLGKDLSMVEIRKLVSELGVDTLKKIGLHLSPAEIAEFVKELGEARVKDLAKRYGGEAMKHYGHAFFKTYKGATTKLRTHLLTNDGIKGGEIKGCHDQATFLDELVTKGNGQIVGSTVHPARADVVKHEYKLFRKKADGSFELDAAGQKVLSTGKAKIKTTIDNLTGTIADWLKIADDAADEAIKGMRLPAAGGQFTETVGGLSIGGFVRGGEIDTIFVIF
jgi:hypothetical protein